MTLTFLTNSLLPYEFLHYLSLAENYFARFIYVFKTLVKMNKGIMLDLNEAQNNIQDESKDRSSSPSSPVVVELRKLVEQYLSHHPRLNLQTLASRSQVPVTTLRRLIQDEKKSEVAPHIVLNLCSYILKEKKVTKLLLMLPMVLADFLRKYFGSFCFEGANERVYDDSLNNILKDKLNYLIYKLAANHQGTNFIELSEIFGITGVARARELINQEFLIVKKVQQANGIEIESIVAKDQDFTLNLTTAASHLPELTKFYRPDCVGKNLNLMYSLSEGLNKNGIAEVKRLQKKAIEGTLKIMQDPHFQGTIPYFTLNLCESFYYETDKTPGALS
jgi:hypothetical protein